MTERMKADVTLPDAIDLSDPSGRLPLKLRMAFSQILGDVPGVHLDHVKLTNADGETPVMELAYHGWSPSLHAIRYAVDYTIDHDPRSAAFIQAAATAIEASVDQQIQRHRAGARFGLAKPLFVDKDDMKLETRHLTVDTALPLFAMLADDDLAWEIDQSIGQMHRRGATDDGSSLFNGAAYALHCGLGHLVGTNIHYDMPGGDRLICDGLSIEIIGRTVPEMALGQMEGRPLSDLTTIHPAIDGRIVRSAESGDADKSPRMRITLVPEVIPMAKAPEYKARLARG